MVLASRRERVYQQFPDPVNGYELDPERGYFSVIIPEATTNLVTNPSVEDEVTTGYAGSGGGAIAATFAWQAYGACGLAVTPVAVTESGVYYDGVALTSGSTYTASIVIQGETGKVYYIWFASQAGALIGTKRKWIGTGHKQRIWVTYTETANLTRRVYVTRDAAYNDVNVFYVDGLQVEAKSYPTTYCDGDQVGFVINEAAYYWNGIRRASTSTRTAQTRAGGREMSLLNLGLRILTILGLGMSPLVDQALPMPGRGELVQGTGTTAREFTLVSALYADGPGPRHLQALRSGLIDAFKPDLVTIDQPLILRYQACDNEGDPLGESLDIICKYKTGLEGNWDNHQQERIPITFKMHLPLIQNTYDKGAELGYQTMVANANDILMRDNLGVWQVMTTGISPGVARRIVLGPDGSMYIGGTFTGAGGVANTAGIARWNGTAWSALAGGIHSGGEVTGMVFDAAGNMYMGGNFIHVHDGGGGAVANTENIARWDGAAWSSISSGMIGSIRDMAIDPLGRVFAVGSFTQINGLALSRIAMWDGSNWYGLGSGISGGGGDVRSILVDPNKNALGTYDIYVGGDFLTAGGISAPYIAKWNGLGWESLAGGANAQVLALAMGPDSVLYAGGDFTIIGGVARNYIASWNGTAWYPLGVGSNNSVSALMFNNSLLYAGGIFTSIGGITPPDQVAIWNGSRWAPFDVDLPVAGSVTIFGSGRNGFIYISFTLAGSSLSATVSVTSIGSAVVYPRIIFTGPGTVYQLKNYTTGKAIYFDLTLANGEIADLNLDPANIYFISSFRGNILPTILPGSNLDFPLLPGNNNVSSYMYGLTGATTSIVMSWREQYWSLDGAAWK